MSGLTELERELREGLAGVTPGPWFVDSEKSDGSYGAGDDTHEGFQSYFVASETVQSYGHPAKICDTLNADTAEVHEEWDEDGHSAWDEAGRKNMEHIARCSPNNIRSLLDEIERLREAVEFANANGFQWPSDPLAARSRGDGK